MGAPVFITGRGLACGLAPTLEAALAALAGGGVAPQRLGLAGGFGCPYFAIDNDSQTPWSERAQHWVRQVASECGALEGARRGALFIASSSMDIGGREDSGEFDGSFDDFTQRVAAWLGWQGPVYSVSTACTSGLNALLSAQALVSQGLLPDALVMGIELRSRVTPGGFLGMQLLAAERARPMGLGRDGMVLGEAVAALHLTRRPARWRLAGGANHVDGRDAAGAALGAVESTCCEALRRSAVAADDIGLVKLQAAGSPANDATEIQALHRVFGARMPPLTSLKASIGHTLGAAGVAELALLTGCLENGAWPSVDGEVDPALGATLASHPPRTVRHLLANIFGFGGGHAAVVLEDMQA
jgi:3-oxoacyl-[acyl-carrier-protein] synthase-1